MDGQVPKFHVILSVAKYLYLCDSYVIIIFPGKNNKLQTNSTHPRMGAFCLQFSTLHGAVFHYHTSKTKRTYQNVKY